MPRRLDIGIASYGNPQRLQQTLASIKQQCRTDWRCFVIDNPGPAPEVRGIIEEAARQDARFVPVFLDANVGYAGAVNKLFELAETDHIAYCDNDIEIRTPGWDEKLCEVMDANAECGWVFPGRGHYGFHNGRYDECLWNAGYCWVLRKDAAYSVDLLCSPAEYRFGCNCRQFCTCLGHHEEVDYMIRLRLAGYQIGCRPDVNVIHHETATQANAADHKPGGRIHDGVVRWMNKWNNYFCGRQLKYSMTAYDPSALRYTDWHPCALYLERMTLGRFPDWNQKPRIVNVPGVGDMDAVEVLKPAGPYKGRAI